MRLQFIGTGANEGIPGVFCGCPVCQAARAQKGRDIRHRAAAVVDGHLLIDFPPDIYAQSVDEPFLVDCKNLLVTHGHRDHLYVDDLLNLREPYTLTQKPPLAVYSSESVRQQIGERFAQCGFDDCSAFVTLHTLTAFTPRDIDGYTVTALPARHCPGAFIYLIERDGSALLYATDTGYFPEETWDYLADCRLQFVVMDCCNLSGIDTRNHMNIEDNITVMRRLYSQGITDDDARYAATHFSHVAGLNHRGIEQCLRPYGIITAYDKMSIEF